MMKQKIADRYLWGIILGCFLYGVSFLFLFSSGASLWGRLASGFLGVGAITLLPVFYGLCLQRLASFDGVALEIAVLHSFCLVGIFTIFSLPLCCLFAGENGAFGVGYTLLSMLIFHGALWYECFILAAKR